MVYNLIQNVSIKEHVCTNVTGGKMVVLSSFLAPQEGIRHEEPNTTVYINAREVGKGTLYITERYNSLFMINTHVSNIN